MSLLIINILFTFWVEQLDQQHPDLITHTDIDNAKIFTTADN